MTLNAHHHTMLHTASAITAEVIKARGYASIDDPRDVQDLGFTKAQARTAPVLVVPLWDVHGHQSGWQIRPDSPRQMKDGKVFKYETPKGGRLQLDVHPSVQPMLGDPQVPLWITEGVRKGDALVSHGACAIALMGGVWGFRGSNAHGGKVILPDWEYIALNGRLVYVAYDSDLATKKGVQAALAALWRFLRDRQALPARVQWPEVYQQKKWGVDDFLAEGKTLEDLLRMVPPVGPLPATTQRAAPAADVDTLPYSDYTNALALVREHGEGLHYCYPWKSWLVWTDTHWQRDEAGRVMRHAKETIKRLARHIETVDDDQAAAALLRHVKSSLSAMRLKGMIELTQSEEGIPVQPEALDADPWLLNCTNGTLDLRLGTLRPHDRTTLLTKCLPVAYDKDAECSVWKAFLWRIMDHNQEMIDFLQRVIGYALTGSTREQCMFILHGPTKTGKSTFLMTLRALLGPYGQQADMQSFMHQDREGVRNDLADLAGSRLVCALESQEGRRLAESLIKQVTGGVDHLKARFLFEEHFTFKPQFKLFLGTNHKPAIRDTDSAIWERIRLVPFTVQIPPQERDKSLDAQLLEELPGILAWAVRGCLEWQRLDDLKPPDVVTAATEGYRDEMDEVGRFLREVCTLKAEMKTRADRLLKTYHQWSGQTSMSSVRLAKILTDKGYVSKREHTGMLWHGIGVPYLSDEGDR
jgi:P4 family phage/plasmid primase-like protien